MARRTKAQIQADKQTAQDAEIEQFKVLVKNHPLQPFVQSVLTTRHRELPTGQVVTARAIAFKFPISEVVIGIASSNVGDIPNAKLGGLVAHYNALQATKATLVSHGLQF